MAKRVGNIYSSIYDIENIKDAHKRARKDKSFYEAVQKTDEDLEARAQTISNMLKNHTYKPGLYKTSRYSDRGKERILYKLPYYPDRIIQWAIMLQIEPYFNRVFEPFTCASLPGRGIHYASNLLTKYLELYPNETLYCLKLDIKKFYPSIDRKILKKLLRKLFKDKDLLYELDNIIDSFDKNDSYKLNLTEEEQAIYNQPGKGVPVGSYLSQYFANFYLSYFDHWLKEECKCKFVIRYMDDLVILSDSKKYLHNLLCAIKIYLKEELQLIVKNNYRIFPTSQGIDFVGYKHFCGYKLLRKTSQKRFKKILLNVKEKGLKLVEKDWCSTISIAGWLEWGNTYHFSEKYLFPLIGIIGSYYTLNKASLKRKKNIFRLNFLFYNKYINQYRKYQKKFIQKNNRHLPIHLKNRSKYYDKTLQRKSGS